MAKQRLFPRQQPPSDTNNRKPHDKFSDLAAKIVTVPKSEIDEREKDWQERKG